MSNRKEALEDMQRAMAELFKVIEAEKRRPGDWKRVEFLLLDVRDAWEGAKCSQIVECLGSSGETLQ